MDTGCLHLSVIMSRTLMNRVMSIFVQILEFFVMSLDVDLQDGTTILCHIIFKELSSLDT